MKLVLASTSVYRRALLERLKIDFDCVNPNVEEVPHPNELPAALAQRLAIAKASAAAKQNANAWVIGSDQVAEFDGRLLGKPGDRTNAMAQLNAMSGQAVNFFTAVALLRAGSPPQLALDVTRVLFRALSHLEIERYLQKEPAYDCAGSFKSEGFGIALFEKIESEDPTALVGLPLIATSRLLRLAGFSLP